MSINIFPRATKANGPRAALASFGWVNRTVTGITMATFFSDVSHEMATAVLPLYFATIGLGPAALGITEGLADFLFSLAKLAGGIVGHHVSRKRPLASAGYLLTAVATAAMGLAKRIVTLASLRATAWLGRGVRGPLRDYLLAEAVEPTHFGRAYGLERAGDMLGAVVGPLLATLLVWHGLQFQPIIGWTILPGLAATGCMLFLVKERGDEPSLSWAKSAARTPTRLPGVFWLFLGGVFLFGIGDFSRTFLIWLAAKPLGFRASSGTVSIAVLLYALHNFVSAIAAYPIGRWGDQVSKSKLLAGGYGIGVLTNLLLTCFGNSLNWLVLIIVLSGTYIAAEEALEKAAAAEILPRELRSFGFGVLAFSNAFGDVLASVYVGFSLQHGHFRLAFAIASAMGFLGTLWMMWFAWIGQRRTKSSTGLPNP
jgi:MFS family permease